MERRWYELARRLAALTNNFQDESADLLGVKLTKQRRCTLRRVAGLHPRVGRLMDDVALPYRHVRFIAHAPDAAMQKDRARQRIGEWLANRERVDLTNTALYRELVKVLDEPGPGVRAGKTL